MGKSRAAFSVDSQPAIPLPGSSGLATSGSALAAVQAVHEAALTPARWEDALERIAELLGESRTIAMLSEQPVCLLALAATACPPEGRAAALARAAGELALSVSNYGALAKSGQARPEEPEAGADRLIHIHQVAGNVGEEEAAAAIRTHLALVARMHERLRRAENGATAMLDLLDRCRHGVVLVDAGAIPCFMNDRAKTLLDRADGLAVGLGGLRAICASDTRHLRDLIAMAGNGGHDAAPLLGAGTVICLRRGPLASPLLVRIVPTGGTFATAPGLPSVVAALFIREADAIQEIDRDLLVEAYGLTPREATVVALLAEGNSLAEIAGRLGISAGTTRHHLKHALAKTGTHRQAELVRLVLQGFTAPGW